MTNTDTTPDPVWTWIPGTVANVSIRGCHAAPLQTHRAIRRGNRWVTDGGSWDDVNIELVRPLAVIDPSSIDLDALRSIHDTVQDSEDLAWDSSERDPNAGLRAALAHLGIDTP